MTWEAPPNRQGPQLFFNTFARAQAVAPYLWSITTGNRSPVVLFVQQALPFYSMVNRLLRSSGPSLSDPLVAAALGEIVRPPAPPLNIRLRHVCACQGIV